MLKMYQDFSDLLSELNAHGVEFLIVGGYAVGAHGHERATKDLDVWVRPVPVNAKRVFKALGAFGAPLDDLTIKDLSRRGTIFQIGVPPVRIDIITSIGRIKFENAWEKRMKSKLGNQHVFVLSREDLIANKEETGRPQDIADAKWLRKNT
jgi:hypothetical protein